MNAIELRGLEKHYPNFTFGPVDLTLPSGCIMGLVGVNGAGKTTLFRLLLGMAKREGGSVRLLGQDAEGNANLKEELGVVLESAGFPACLTPAEIGSFLKGCYRRWDEKKYKELLARFRVGEGKYSALSRGMKMKLLLAAALSHEPRLLLLDEATSGLDPVARQDILDMLMELEAVVSFRRSPYGVTAVVRQGALPAGVPVQRVGLEELFRALVQEEDL